MRDAADVDISEGGCESTEQSTMVSALLVAGGSRSNLCRSQRAAPDSWLPAGMEQLNEPTPTQRAEARE